MIRKQIATILNEVAKEVLGSDIIFAEDLSNVVDVGKTFLNVVAENKAYDSVFNALIDKTGKTIIVDRSYSQSTPDLVRDAWEYGSILEKIRIDVPEATENNTWGLEAGKKYDDILVYDPPEISASFYNKRVTFSISVSYPAAYTLNEAFKSGTGVNRLFSGIDNRIRTGMKFYTGIMSQRTLNNLAAMCRGRRINLLAMYNLDHTDAPLTVEEALSSREFYRYAAMKISLYSDYMIPMSTNFNNGDYKAHSPKAYQHFCVLSAFAKGIDTYSLSDTYHNEFVKLIKYETVPFWQGVADEKSGDTVLNKYNFDALSKISVIPADGTEEVTLNGVVGILFDKDAAAICCENERVTSFYNAENETTKYYYKWDCAYENDLNENCIVFTVEDVAISNTIVAPEAGTTEVFGHLVSALQSDVAVTGNKITGTLNFIEGGLAQTGPLAGDGHFLAVKFTDTNNTGYANIKAGLSPTAGTGLVTLDGDYNAVFKVAGVLNGRQQVLKVVTTVNGESKVQVYDLSGLNLATS